MKNKNVIYVFVFSFLFMFSGCQKLDVENLNNPDAATALATPEDLSGLAGGIISNWFGSVTSYYGLSMAMSTGSDHGTCSHGNAGMKDFSSEPRVAWNNDAAYSNAGNTVYHFSNMNAALSLSNQILQQIVVNGVELQTPAETAMVTAVARLGQGLGLGYLGLVFDQAFIVDETTVLGVDEVLPATYAEVRDAAVAHLDEVIAICNANTFTLPAAWINGMAYTNVELGQFASTMAARLLVYTSRNATENAATDWSRVKGYAQNGITADFAPVADNINWGGYNVWYYGTFWISADMYLVNKIAPNLPQIFPASGDITDLPNDGIGISDDARLETDFAYQSDGGAYRPERGYYHYSSYYHTRYSGYANTRVGPMEYIRKAENDLLLAEAMFMLGDAPGAAAVVNAGTRVARGGLAPVAAADVAEAISYERDIELFHSDFCVAFYDMRRADLLQAGTPLHFPLPAAQLDVMLMENYTFGGIENADGINTSNGGWK